MTLKVGITLPQAGRIANKENVLRMASMAEKSGFDSLWVFERLLWPVSPQTPYPGTPDGKLPEEYQIMLDPLQTLAFASANTSEILLGTCVIDKLFHNPVILARGLATLDIFSNGRTIAGFGIGWSKDEYQASNVPFNNKGKRADEYLKVLKRIWQDDDIEYRGQYYNITKSKIGPKPVQKPHIPIYLGGFSPNTIGRIIENDLNGWLGVIGGIAPFEYVKSIIDDLRDKAAKSNKNTNNFKVILLAYPDIKNNTQPSDNNARSTLTGTIDEVGNDITKIKGLGVDHVIFAYNFSSIGKDIDTMVSVTKQLSEFAK